MDTTQKPVHFTTLVMVTNHDKTALYKAVKIEYDFAPTVLTDEQIVEQVVERTPYVASVVLPDGRQARIEDGKFIRLYDYSRGTLSDQLDRYAKRVPPTEVVSKKR